MLLFQHWSHVVRNYGARRSAEEKVGADRGSLGFIERVSPTTEQVQALYYGGGGVITVTHPYNSIRSWIRTMPEEGTAAVVQQRADTAKTEITYYWSGNPAARITDYKNGKGHYRPLDLGEIEISSYGMAQAFFSRRGALHLRGGIVRGWLHNDDMEAGFKAAVHRRVLHDHTSATLGDEERFGVVWRKGEDYTKRDYVKVGDVFAKEYMRSFSTRAGNLVHYQEGNVVNEDGEQLAAPSGLPLRVYGRWFDSANVPVENLVDSDGNVWWTLTTRSTVGWTTKLPKGTFRVEAGDKIQLGALKDIEISGQNMIVKARENLYLQAGVNVVIDAGGAFVVRSPNIKLNERRILAGGQDI